MSHGSMTPMPASFVEHVWTYAHSASWFPGWALFQFVALILGGLLVSREGGHRLVAPYALGVVLAVLGAVMLGSGGGWATWVVGPRTSLPPELEVAGFGALVGLLAGHVVGARARRVSVARALDVLAPSIGVMIVVARLGCFFAGCDFGRPTSVAWALRYPTMTPAFRAQLDAGIVHAGASQTVPVHPTQLYEALIGVVVLVVTLRVRASKRDGDRFVLAALLYAVGRIVVDVFRGDLVHGGALGLTITQGLALALIGVVIAWRGARGRVDASSHARAVSRFHATAARSTSAAPTPSPSVSTSRDWV